MRVGADRWPRFGTGSAAISKAHEPGAAEAIGLEEIDTPPRRQAVQAWRRLDRRTRWEVARRGVGHPDPRVAVIAVGRARATLRAPLRRWVMAAVAAWLVNAPLGWVILRLMGGPDDRWFWLWMPITMTPGPLMALRVQARQVERANLPMVGGPIRPEPESSGADW